MRLKINLIIFLLLALGPKQVFSDAKYLFADKVEYNDTEEYVEAIGNVQIAFDNYIIHSERILYDIKKNEVWSYGKISTKDGNKYISLGDAALIKNKAKEAIISSFILYFQGADAIIAAKLAIRRNKNHSSLEKASYTACPACSKYKPIWQISARKADIYLDKQRAIYKNMFFEIYGIPVLYFPYFSHPLPGAKPKSGILIPNIKHKKPGLPIYFRPKSNFDITLTPRIHKNGGLYDLEVRHLLDYGSYRINGLTLGRKSEIPILEGKKVVGNKKINRYHIHGEGDFQKEGSHYGFKFNRVSDRDFLRKYSKIDSPFLVSRMYSYKVDKANFWEVNNSLIQGLRPEDKESSNAKILPEIGFRNIYDLPKLGDSNLKLENYTSSYMTSDLGRVSRSIWEVNLYNSHITNAGHVLGMELYNRSDIYNVNLENNIKDKNSTFTRHIPEARFSIKYPFLGRIRDNSFIIEPIGMFALGKKKLRESPKIHFIDSQKYDFDDINFYKFNRFNGYDYHEAGDRVTYGARTVLKTKNDIRTGLFIGQLQNLSNKQRQKPNIVGRFHVNASDQLELYYRFKRKSKNFRSAFDEVGFWVTKNKVALSGGYISLSKSELLSNNAIKQIYLDTNYDYSQYWAFGLSSRIDVRKSKPREMTRGLRVTYKGDCVTIATNLTSDYTSDALRGIKKTSDYSVAISLKTLDM